MATVAKEMAAGGCGGVARLGVTEGQREGGEGGRDRGRGRTDRGKDRGTEGGAHIRASWAACQLYQQLWGGPGTGILPPCSPPLMHH